MIRHYTTGFENGIFVARIYCGTLFSFIHETALLEYFMCRQAAHSAFKARLWARYYGDRIFDNLPKNRVKNFFQRTQNKLC
jgi:hypothetical protein